MPSSISRDECPFRSRDPPRRPNARLCNTQGSLVNVLYKKQQHAVTIYVHLKVFNARFGPLLPVRLKALVKTTTVPFNYDVINLLSSSFWLNPPITLLISNSIFSVTCSCGFQALTVQNCMRSPTCHCMEAVIFSNWCGNSILTRLCQSVLCLPLLVVLFIITDFYAFTLGWPSWNSTRAHRNMWLRAKLQNISICLTLNP